MTKLLLALVLSSALCAGAGKAPTIDQSLSFESASNPQVSPDGNWVAYQQWHTDWEQNRFLSHLWVVSRTAPYAKHELVGGQGFHCDLQWSPDGSRIAFLSDRKNGRQVWVVDASGGEGHRLTETDRGVNAFRWAPDGKSIAFTADGGDPAEGARAERYGLFDIIKAESTAAGLWLVPVPGGASGPNPNGAIPDAKVLVSDADFSVGGFSWSPDGKSIAFQAERTRVREAGAIYVLSLRSFDSKKLTRGPGPYRNPIWSPDSRWVAFEEAASLDFHYANWFAARVSATGGDRQILTGDFDENADLVAWTSSGIWFGALQKTASHLFLLNPDANAESRKIQRITGPDPADYSQFSVNGQDVWAAVAGSTSSLPELVSGGAVLTTFGDQAAGGAKDVPFASREVVRWKGLDGTELEGILMKPAGFDPTKKYPLLVILHGGPVAVDQPMVRPDRTYPTEQFVENGALVFRPNYRGSAGYGAKLRGLNVRNLGSGDADDILAGIDALAARGFVDKERTGAMGWSQGGFIAAFLGMSTDRFRAVSVGAGISDWTTYYVNTDITNFTRQYMQSTPWQDPEAYRKASPISYVNRAKTPTLIQHGDQDRRVPIPNAYELRQALEDRGVPVKMIVYRGFGHTIDRPRQQRALMEQNLEWFNNWVLGPLQRHREEPLTARTSTGSRKRSDGVLSRGALNTGKK